MFCFITRFLDKKNTFRYWMWVLHSPGIIIPGSRALCLEYALVSQNVRLCLLLKKKTPKYFGPFWLVPSSVIFKNCVAHTDLMYLQNLVIENLDGPRKFHQGVFWFFFCNQHISQSAVCTSHENQLDPWGPFAWGGGGGPYQYF